MLLALIVEVLASTRVTDLQAELVITAAHGTIPIVMVLASRVFLHEIRHDLVQGPARVLSFPLVHNAGQDFELVGAVDCVEVTKLGKDVLLADVRLD